MTDRPVRGLGRGLGALIPSGPAPASTGVLDAHDVPPANVISQIPAPATSPEHQSPVDRRTDNTDQDPAGEAAAASAGAWFAEVPPTSIRPNPRQPRTVFDEDAMAELVASIRAVGLLQPVVVRPVGDRSFELVMGERRWRAAQEAGLAAIPVIVRETDDEVMLRDALLENLHRAQLNALEEANAYQQLLDDFGCSHEELAQRIGRSRSQVTNTLRLLKLSAPVQRRVAAGVLSAGHARTLLGVSDAQAQDRLADRVVAEGISVRGLEEIVALGDTPAEPGVLPPVRRTSLPSPEVAVWADQLGDLLDTRVRIDVGRRKGRIVIDFAAMEDLRRLVDVLTQATSRHDDVTTPRHEDAAT